MAVRRKVVERLFQNRKWIQASVGNSSPLEEPHEDSLSWNGCEKYEFANNSLWCTINNRCGKKQYSSQKKANKARKKSMKTQPGLQLAVYRCKDCNGFHLSKHLHRID